MDIDIGLWTRDYNTEALEYAVKKLTGTHDFCTKVVLRELTQKAFATHFGKLCTNHYKLL